MSSEKNVAKNNNYKNNRDHPEQYPTEQKSLFDRFESQQTVDAIPMEDLKLEKREEKEKHKTKNNSSSKQKYK
ncbi:hypothetical protein DS745_21380 [Anaerobacillus alkaliphilus]|uniref:Uncharacterized protein n=1 Tax=Anaerobacillus alkaliphilus TaxID=1548597 RepID=A0A4Q0VMV1_9BACI|nr:hypothetical protein [Anaerobacillus alkaliphilus]RXI96286.1 hypothetical protein DS745_21380 [Anaerobacillus alkaliphilus]